MNSTPNSVAPEEDILRRVHQNHCLIDQPMSVLPAAFRPSKADTTGLSVFREHLTSPNEVATSGRKTNEYFVVRLHVTALHDLGLTVVSDDEPDGPAGHALIPELSVSAYQNNKSKLKPILVELARLASEDIVFEPDT